MGFVQSSLQIVIISLNSITQHIFVQSCAVVVLVGDGGGGGFLSRNWIF
jgi:hypothetical protein